MTVVSGLFQQQNRSDQWLSKVLLYVVLLLPLVYVTGGFAYLLLHQAGGCIGKINNQFCVNKLRKGKKREGFMEKSCTVPVTIVGFDTDEEREPLLEYQTS